MKDKYTLTVKANHRNTILRIVELIAEDDPISEHEDITIITEMK